MNWGLALALYLLLVGSWVYLACQLVRGAYRQRPPQREARLPAIWE